MIIHDKNGFDLTTDALCLKANAVPWDSDIFGFPVAVITTFDVKNIDFVQHPFDLFKIWVRDNAFEVVSCRLPHQQVETSMFLERNDFRFVEMVLHPVVRALQTYPATNTEMVVEQVCEAELSSVVSMAERSFVHERYHIDPRLDSTLANARYGCWVRSSFYDLEQVLLKVRLGGDIVGFFVVENKSDNSVYWHLTAVNPDFQGKKMGYDIWMAMINYHKRAGMQSILTTISARNSPVLNLYSKLNFRFAPSEMTFHWVKSDQ